jgi:hypothetical protein
MLHCGVQFTIEPHRGEIPNLSMSGKDRGNPALSSVGLGIYSLYLLQQSFHGLSRMLTLCTPLTVHDCSQIRQMNDDPVR